MANPFVHTEIRTRDREKCQYFYQSLFDWDVRVQDGYGLIETGTPPGGGMFQAPPRFLWASPSTLALIASTRR